MRHDTAALVRLVALSERVEREQALFGHATFGALDTLKETTIVDELLPHDDDMRRVL